MLRVKDRTIEIPIYNAAIMAILTALFEYSKEAKHDIVITCGKEAHTSGSHPKSKALDVRSKNFPSKKAKHEFKAWLEKMLGPYFTVLLENEGKYNEHFHIQVKIGMEFS
jgi:hypothetical protein